jgi:dihydroneopterin aldolase
MYSVFLKNQKVNCPVGWYDEERKSGVLLDVSVEAELTEVPQDHDLDGGLDYIRMCEIVNAEASVERKLIETLAQAICDRIWNEKPNLISKIIVTIEKCHIQNPQFNGYCCGIRIEKKYKSD